MSSLETDNNKKQKTDNTGTKKSFKNLDDNILRHISNFVLPTDSVKPMFRIEFKFETPQDQINVFYRDAGELVQEENTWRNDYNEDNSYYRTFEDYMYSEHEGEENGFDIDDFVAQCSMFERCTISLTLTDVGAKRIQYNSYKNLFNSIKKRVYTSVRQNGNRNDAVPFKEANTIDRDNNGNITHAEFKIISMRENEYNELVQATRGLEMTMNGQATTLSNYKKPKQLFLFPQWVHGSYVDDPENDDHTKSEWLGEFGVVGQEAEKLEILMGNDNELTFPNSWDIVLRYHCVHHDDDDVDNIENQTLQAVLHDTDDDDDFLDDNGGITSINTSNWYMDRKTSFVNLIKNIREDVSKFYNGNIQMDVDTNFGNPLSFDNGNIGEHRRPLIYALICSGSRGKKPLNRYQKNIGVKFYKDKYNLKF